MKKEKNFHLVSEQLAQILSAFNSSPVLSKEPPGSSKVFLHSLSNIPLVQTGGLWCWACATEAEAASPKEAVQLWGVQLSSQVSIWHSSKLTAKYWQSQQVYQWSKEWTVESQHTQCLSISSNSSSHMDSSLPCKPLESLILFVLLGPPFVPVWVTLIGSMYFVFI